MSPSPSTGTEVSNRGVRASTPDVRPIPLAGAPTSLGPLRGFSRSFPWCRETACPVQQQRGPSELRSPECLHAPAVCCSGLLGGGVPVANVTAAKAYVPEWAFVPFTTSLAIGEIGKTTIMPQFFV